MTHPRHRIGRPALAAALLATALVGCGDATVDGEDAGWRSWTSTAGAVSGPLFVPAAPGTIGSGRALMVVLHGCAQSGEDLRDGVDWADTAEDFGMVVSLPNVPDGGVLAGCWDYYGLDHTRTSGLTGALLDHVDGLLADPSLDIDPDQVYIAGLSSGAGMTMVMGCLAPDVFAGMGIVAGPTVGTSVLEIQALSSTEPEGRAGCESLAGTASSSFATQLTAAIAGDFDTMVAQGYAHLNAEVMANLYADAAGLGGLTAVKLDVPSLPGVSPSGTGGLFYDAQGPRVSRISGTAMGHVWPAGNGSLSGGFISGQGIDYGRYLAEFFTANNRRVSGQTSPGVPTGTAPCDPWLDTATNLLAGHVGRYESYDQGYGAYDATYTSLLWTFGTLLPFTLYEGIDGRWYRDTANLPPALCP